MLSDLLHRLRVLFRRKSMEAELDEELRAHLQREVEKHVRSGLPREDAARRARLEFGGLDQVKEECRDARGVNFVETLFQDARHGLRVALGAARLDIVRLVVGQALLLSLAGTAAGLIGALALTRYLAGMLYSVHAIDPLIFAGVSVFLVGLSLVASLIPARRATKVDPAVALRCE